MANDTLFRQKAPAIMRALMRDFALDAESAAAILGNLGHESGGFRFLQEKQPLVPGSAGGYGWAQWTGPRRRQYEAYCKRNSLDPAGDKANYGFLFVELSSTEAQAIPAVKAAVGLVAKVKAFELAFERAGVKHYDSRITWAGRALAAYHGEQPSTLPPKPVPAPTVKEVATKAVRDAGVGGAAVGAGKAGETATTDPSLPWGEILLVTVIIAVLVFAVSFAWRWWRARQATVADAVGAPDAIAPPAAAEAAASIPVAAPERRKPELSPKRHTRPNKRATKRSA